MPWPTSDRTTEKPLASTCVLDGVRDVAEPVAGPALLDRAEQRLLGDLEQPAATGETSPTGKVRARVGHPAVLDHADVDRQDVALAQLEAARDAVHDHVVAATRRSSPGSRGSP